MKVISVLFSLIRINFVNKFLRKIIISLILSIFTFIVIINPHFVSASIIPRNLTQLILSKKNDEYGGGLGKRV